MLNQLNIINQFENVSFDVWHNLQELPQVDNILSFQNLSIDVFQNFLQSLLWCYYLWNQLNMLFTCN
jgi:hypothetical protein